jgi:hypothetical protein
MIRGRGGGKEKNSSNNVADIEEPDAMRRRNDKDGRRKAVRKKRVGRLCGEGAVIMDVS